MRENRRISLLAQVTLLIQVMWITILSLVPLPSRSVSGPRASELETVVVSLLDTWSEPRLELEPEIRVETSASLGEIDFRADLPLKDPWVRPAGYEVQDNSPERGEATASPQLVSENQPRGPTFLGVAVPQRRVVFVLDASESMRRGQVWATLCDALEGCLTSLGPDVRFQVILYADEPRLMRLAGRGLAPATPLSVRSALEQLRQYFPAGGTNHQLALEEAVRLRPEAIFLLTDGDDLLSQAKEWLARQRVPLPPVMVLHLRQRGQGGGGEAEASCRWLSERTRGRYQEITLE